MDGFPRALASLRAFLATGVGDWTLVAAHGERGTGRAYRGSLSIELIYVRTTDGERIVQHIIVRNQRLLHDTFRSYAKFGQSFGE
jgi:hypothetical protein